MNSSSAKIFGFTLLIVIISLFIWTGGIDTVVGIINATKTPTEDYQASLPRSKDLILHGSLLTLVSYLVFTLVTGEKNTADKLSSEIIFNVNNLITDIYLPKNLIDLESDEKQQVLKDQPNSDKILAEGSRHLPSNSLSEFEKSVIESDSEISLSKEEFKSVKRKINIRNSMEGYSAVSKPPPYPMSFLAKESTLRYVEKFDSEKERLAIKGTLNKKVASSSIERAMSESITSSENSSDNSNTSKMPFDPMAALRTKIKKKPVNPMDEIKRRLQSINQEKTEAPVKKEDAPIEEKKPAPSKENSSSDRPDESAAKYFD